MVVIAEHWHRKKYPGVYTGMTLSPEDFDARCRMKWEIEIFLEGLRAGLQTRKEWDRQAHRPSGDARE